MSFFSLFALTLFAQSAFKQNGKYEVKDDSENTVVEPIYKKIESIYRDNPYVFKGFNDGAWYLLTNAEMVEL